MALTVTDPQHYQDIADAIRTLNGSQNTYTPGQMATAILATAGSGGSSTKYGVSIDELLGEVSSDTLQTPAGSVDLIISGFKKLAQYALYYKFCRSARIHSVTFPDLEEIADSYAFQYAFYNCTGITSATFTKLNKVSGSSAMGNAFYGCTNLVSASFPELLTIDTSSAWQYIFYNCTNLETVSLPKLTQIGPSSSAAAANRQFYYAFNGCTKLTSITFPELTTIYCNGNGTTYGTFANNTKVKKWYFPKLSLIAHTSGYTNANKAQPLENLFYNCSDMTELHFALANKTAIQACTGYSANFGIPSGATIYFDL